MRTANEAATYALDNYCGPRKALEAPRLRHLPWLTLARFGKWDEILNLPQPANTNDFLVDRAIWHFTRGLAFAAKKDAAAVEREQQALVAIAASDEAKALSSPVFPAQDTLNISAIWLTAKAAGARGDTPGMISYLEKAVAAADAMPYMEPAYWPIPLRPALGAALLQSGDAVKAEEVFREDLRRWPRNGWSLLGLEQSLRRQGKTQGADLVQREFNTAWKRADVKLSLDWF